MSKKESKVMKLYRELGRLEDQYNMFSTERRLAIPAPFCGQEDITDKKVIDAIINYYGDKINKLKQELKKELDKKL